MKYARKAEFERVEKNSSAVTKRSRVSITERERERERERAYFKVSNQQNKLLKP